MAQKRRTAEQLAEALDAVLEHGSVNAAARALNIPYGTFQHVVDSARAWEAAGRPPIAGSTGGDGIVVSGDEASISKTTTEKVKSLADLIRVCEIDTGEWDIVEWTCKASQQASVPRTVRVNGKWQRPSTEPLLTQMFHVGAKLRRKSPMVRTLEQLKGELLTDLKALPKAPAVKPRRMVENGWLFEFAPTDLHMGKYTWDEETVTNFDIEKAAELFDASLDHLFDLAMRVTSGKLERILCVFGNDVCHIDSKRGETTAGTRMDVDTRYIKVYRRIVAVHRRAIEKCRAVAPVDIKIVSGNHDELTSFHLGEILSERYDGVKHVTVDNGAKLRKYYEFGTNLFGFTHGDSEKVAELPLTMAREQPEAWARCGSREWHIGHLHKGEGWSVARSQARDPRHRPGMVEQDYFSDKGVRIRRLASLSAHDAWHTRHAYMDRRTCEGFVFHREAGFTADLSFNVDHFSGRGQKTA
jgi:hypothetical protein